MDTYAGLVHADLSAMLRESDAFCRNMEESMTPERAMMYSQLMTGVLSYQNIVIAKDGIWHESAITDLLRQAVNEALEEAAKVCTDYGAMYCHNAIRALKLPEEP